MACVCVCVSIHAHKWFTKEGLPEPLLRKGSTTGNQEWEEARKKSDSMQKSFRGYFSLIPLESGAVPQSCPDWEASVSSWLRATQALPGHCERRVAQLASGELSKDKLWLLVVRSKITQEKGAQKCQTGIWQHLSGTPTLPVTLLHKKKN